MEPRVSIIVPVYNAEKYIEETVASVVAQTFADWELLLVEDGSSDGSRQAVERMLAERGDERLHLIVQKNAGAAAARNHGLLQASGRYIAFLDADDLWSPDKLEKQLALMEEKKAGFSFTGYEFADENGRGTGKIVRVPETITYRQALQNTTIFTSTVMFDTTVIPRDELRMPQVKSEDTALWFKVLRGGLTAYGLDENLVRYRRVEGSLSANKFEAMKRIWNLYRREEGLSVPYSCYNFFFWAVRAVKRRI